MRIDRSEFGSITVDGKTYDHDVMIGLSGRVSKRKKKLSKQQYGTSHVVSKAEVKAVFEKGCDVIIIGSGQEGNVHLSPEAENYFEERMRSALAANAESDPVDQPIGEAQDHADACHMLNAIS